MPPLGNYFISLFKDTALASTITVKELMFSGQIIAATNFQYFTIYTIAGIIYLGLSYSGSLAGRIAPVITIGLRGASTRCRNHAVSSIVSVPCVTTTPATSGRAR